MLVPQIRRKGESEGGAVGCLFLLILLGGAAYFLFQTDLGKSLFDQGRQMTDAQLILGKWKQVDGPGTDEFFADGTIREERLLGTANGTYKLLPSRRMEIKIDGIFWGQIEGTERYEIRDDELELSTDAGTGVAIRLRRVK